MQRPFLNTYQTWPFGRIWPRWPNHLSYNSLFPFALREWCHLSWFPPTPLHFWLDLLSLSSSALTSPRQDSIHHLILSWHLLPIYKTPPPKPLTVTPSPELQTQLWSISLCFWLKWAFSAIISSHYFSSTLLSSPIRTPMAWMLALWLQCSAYWDVVFFFFFFPVCYSDWVNSMNLSSSPQLPSSIISTLVWSHRLLF